MELHLQNVRTGETVKLLPEGTLIGSADYANVQTAEDGPFLAVLAVRYPSGWVFHGLSDDPEVAYDRQSLRFGQRITPRKNGLLAIGDERFTLLSPRDDEASEPTELMEPPVCLAYVQYPDGQEECRAVDHDLLFGRLEFCHVQFADRRLSRLNALLASVDGDWYIHNLTRKVIGRNRKAVPNFARICDGDELLIGPLVVRVELRVDPAHAPRQHDEDLDSSVNLHRRGELGGLPPPTDVGETTDDGSGEKTTTPDLMALRTNGERLDQWLKGHPPRPPAQKSGLSGWLGAQRDRLKRFWLDTPETTSARSLRAAGRVEEAFGVLERAVRTRPDSPGLLRELYRLYEVVGFAELCYRPLRQIEKLAEVNGSPDPWVLETLAKLCERLGHTDPSWTERAVRYWSKLEDATGKSYIREKSAVMARRALREGGYDEALGSSG